MQTFWTFSSNNWIGFRLYTFVYELLMELSVSFKLSWNFCINNEIFRDTIFHDTFRTHTVSIITLYRNVFSFSNLTFCLLHQGSNMEPPAQYVRNIRCENHFVMESVSNRQSEIYQMDITDGECGYHICIRNRYDVWTKGIANSR